MELEHTSSRQAQIAVGFSEDPQVQQVKYTLVMESKDALEDENMRRVDRSCVLQPGMLFERIHRDIRLLALEIVSR